MSDILVDLRMVMDITDIQEYTAVVVGSAIFNGAWLPEATRFVQQFEDQLATRVVAFFVVSMTMRNDTPQNRRIVESYLQPTLDSVPHVHPISIGLFGGRLQYENLSWIARMFLWLTTRLPSGDFRNWRAIHAWATLIRPATLGEPSSMNTRTPQT